MFCVIILGFFDNFNLGLLFANVSNVNIPVSSKKASSFLLSIRKRLSEKISQT